MGLTGTYLQIFVISAVKLWAIEVFSMCQATKRESSKLDLVHLESDQSVIQDL